MNSHGFGRVNTLPTIQEDAMSVSTAPRAMNLARLLVMSCVLVLAAAPAQARTGKASEMLPAHALDLGYQVMSFYYEEGSLMNEGGVLHGVFGRYTAHLESAPVMLRLEGEYSGGNLDYDGQYQDGTPATRDTDDRLAGARGLVGWTLPMDRAAFIPYTGLGFRYWNDVPSRATAGTSARSASITCPSVWKGSARPWTRGGSRPARNTIFSWAAGCAAIWRTWTRATTP